MRTNIEIDETLIEEAQRVSGPTTKRAVVEEGLKNLIRIKRQREVLDLAGKIEFWEDVEKRRDAANSDPSR